MEKSPRLTSTLLPVPPEGAKNKKYCANGWETCHEWAHNKRIHGERGNVFFHNGVIFSYGGHFPMARHVFNRKTRAKAIFVTTRTYSSSTSKHQSMVARSIPRGSAVFEVDYVLADTAAEHRKNLTDARLRAEILAGKADRARGLKASYLADCLYVVRHANAYAEFVGLPDRIPVPDTKSISDWVAMSQSQRVAAEKAEDARKARARKNEIGKWEKSLALWQSGKSKREPGRFPGPASDPRFGLTYLQVSRRGKTVRTSLGVVLKLSEVLGVLKSVRKKPTPASGNDGGEVKVQHWDGHVFPLDRIVQVGCHRISFDEIERAASVAGV